MGRPNISLTNLNVEGLSTENLSPHFGFRGKHLRGECLTAVAEGRIPGYKEIQLTSGANAKTIDGLIVQMGYAPEISDLKQASLPEISNTIQLGNHDYTLSEVATGLMLAFTGSAVPEVLNTRNPLSNEVFLPLITLPTSDGSQIQGDVAIESLDLVRISASQCNDLSQRINALANDAAKAKS